MRIITEIVKQFQQNWTEELNAENIARACRDCKMNWINSMLNPVVTIQLFFLQILHDNTACTDVRLLANMKMDVLKCKTVDGVLKQRHVFALVYNVGLQRWSTTLVYNLVRQVILAAATRQKIHVNRISFIDALRWLKSADQDSELRDWGVLPHRPNRYEPRVKKRRPKNYKLMTKPRKQTKQEPEQ